MKRNEMEATIALFEARLVECLTKYDCSEILGETISYHFGLGAHGPVRTGKRLRPQMLLRTSEMLGAKLDNSLDAAVAIEILHNYSLVHDDIEDGDELRHGRATLWSRFGVAQAINSGDAMCALSFLALARSESRLGAGRTLAMLACLHHAHRKMCDGQARDLDFESRMAVSLDEYLSMIAGKTAALFRAAGEMGAICADASPEMRERAALFGEAFGMAFQVRDDLLGIWGAEGATGKRVAGDIARRKWSYPIVWALACPDSPPRTVVARAYASGRALNPLEVAAVRAALDELGAEAASRRALDERIAVLQLTGDEPLLAFAVESLN